MLIKGNETYIETLKKLWHEVFGDDYEYINLLFQGEYQNCECFAEIIDGEAVSALYLLKCSINQAGKTFYGRYLYAAATLMSHRGKGYMGKLIDEAKTYAGEKGIDFIALVPAEESLYNYYEKFGFHTVMYKNVQRIDCGDEIKSYFDEITDSKEFYALRNRFDGDMLIYDEIGCDYAFDCLKAAGRKIFRLSEDSYFVYDEAERVVVEFVSQKATAKENFDKLQNILCNEVTVCSPFYGEKVKNGMIFDVKEELKLEDIYMNIALD